MLVTVALRISISAIALFSCSVTQAVRESCEVAIYSGSRSSATEAPGPLILMPVRSMLLKSLKPALTAIADKAPLLTSTIVTLPSGSV